MDNDRVASVSQAAQRDGSLYGPLTLSGGKLLGKAQVGGDLSLCKETGVSQGDGCGVIYELTPRLKVFGWKQCYMRSLAAMTAMVHTAAWLWTQPEISTEKPESVG
jgi:hypothetical protein